VRRREFIALLGGAAAAWPIKAQAQQSAMPVVGFLDGRAATTTADRLRGFQRGLKESGYAEGDNVVILYRWAEGQTERLPELAAELVRRQIAVITATGGTPAALAAKAATTTIPIVFAVPEDPVKLGLVSSLARPGTNLTGVNFLNAEVAGKRLEILREMVPAAKRVALLVNPANVANTEANLKGVEAAARTMGLQIQVVRAGTISEIDKSFETIAGERVDALFVSTQGDFSGAATLYI